MPSVKTSRVLLPSADRAGDTATAIQQDALALAIRLYLNVTQSPGGGGLTVVIRGYDKASGNYVEISQGGAAVTTVGTYAYEMTPYPSDAAFGNIMEATSRAVPYQWDAIVKHADGETYTYSLSAEIVG